MVDFKPYHLSADGKTAIISGYEDKHGNKPVANKDGSYDYKNSIVFGEITARNYLEYRDSKTKTPSLFEVRYLPEKNITDEELRTGTLMIANDKHSTNFKGALFGREYMANIIANDYDPKKSYKSLEEMNAIILEQAGTEQKYCADALDLDDNGVIDLAEQTAKTIAKDFLDNINNSSKPNIDGKYKNVGQNESNKLYDKNHIKENRAFLQKLYNQYGLKEAQDKFIVAKDLEAPPPGKEIPQHKDLKSVHGDLGAFEEQLKSMEETNALMAEMKKDLETEGPINAEKYAEKLAKLNEADAKAIEELNKMNEKIPELAKTTSDNADGVHDINGLVKKAFPEGQLPSDEEIVRLMELNKKVKNGDKSAMGEMKQRLNNKCAENLELKDNKATLTAGSTLGDLVVANKEALSKKYGTTQLWGEGGLVDLFAKDNDYKGVDDPALSKIKAGTEFKLKAEPETAEKQPDNKGKLPVIARSAEEQQQGSQPAFKTDDNGNLTHTSPIEMIAPDVKHKIVPQITK